MKKLIPIMILVLVLAFAFSACSASQPPAAAPEDPEIAAAAPTDEPELKAADQEVTDTSAVVDEGQNLLNELQARNGNEVAMKSNGSFNITIDSDIMQIAESGGE